MVSLSTTANREREMLHVKLSPNGCKLVEADITTGPIVIEQGVV